jgi:membrane protease YdiL (CAAX protease family)
VWRLWLSLVWLALLGLRWSQVDLQAGFDPTPLWAQRWQPWMWLPVFSFWGGAVVWAWRLRPQLLQSLSLSSAWQRYCIAQLSFFFLLPALQGLAPVYFQLAVGLYFLLTLWPLRKLDWRPAPDWWRWGLSAYLLGLLLAVVIYAIFQPSASHNPAVTHLLQSRGGERVLWLFCLCLLTPLHEEAWYRSVLGGPNRQRILFSAALFALVHVDPKALPQLFGLGLLFNWARWGGGYPAAVLAHALWNSTVAVFLLGA